MVNIWFNNSLAAAYAASDRSVVPPGHPMLALDRPVTLLRGNDQINADSLDYVGDDHVALLKGRVKARLAPR